MTVIAPAFNPFGEGYLASPSAFWVAVRRERPVFFTPDPRHLVLTRYLHLQAVLEDQETWRPPAPPGLHSTDDTWSAESVSAAVASVADSAAVELVGDFLRPLYGDSLIAHAMANALRVLLSHRRQWEDICADPALIPGALDECLRYESCTPVIRRTATSSTHIGGVEVPEGTSVLLAVASANHDEDAFSDPAVFDIRRPNAGDQLGFGSTVGHDEPPVELRRRMEITLAEIAARLPKMALEIYQDWIFQADVFLRAPAELWARLDPCLSLEA